MTEPLPSTLDAGALDALRRVGKPVSYAAGAILDVERRLKAEGTVAAEAFEVVEEDDDSV